MIFVLAAAYVAAGAGVSVECAARHRATEGGGLAPDREDVLLLALAGVAWPVTLLAYAWYRAYRWRVEKGERDEPEAEG